MGIGPESTPREDKNKLPKKVKILHPENLDQVAGELITVIRAKLNILLNEEDIKKALGARGGSTLISFLQSDRGDDAPTLEQELVMANNDLVGVGKEVVEDGIEPKNDTNAIIEHYLNGMWLKIQDILSDFEGEDTSKLLVRYIISKKGGIQVEDRRGQYEYFGPLSKILKVGREMQKRGE